MLIGMIAMGPDLSLPGDLCRKIRMIEVVPNQFDQLLRRTEFNHLSAEVEMAGKHRNKGYQLKATATSDFKGTAIEPIHLAIVQGIETDSGRGHRPRFLFREN